MGKLRSELSRVPFLQIVLGLGFSVAVVHRSLEEKLVTGVTDANVTYWYMRMKEVQTEAKIHDVSERV